MNIYKQKIVINFTNGQGLGNQLWIFFSGIQIAQKLNCKIEFGNGKVFKGFFLIKRKFITKKFIEIKRKYIIKESHDLFTNLEVTNYEVEIKNIKKLLKINDLEIIGSLQNSKFIPSKKKILKYLKFKSLKVNSNCTIHVRGGDYKNTIVKPSKKFYESALTLFKKKKILIITDDIKYASSLLPKYPISRHKKNYWDHLTSRHHFSGGIEKDFLKIACSNYNIISASTFSFWASYIGSLFFKKKIVAPAFWFANRVSKSWWSPLNIFINKWIYIDSDGKIIKIFKKNARPAFSVNFNQNKFLNFAIRKFVNFYLNYIKL